MLAVDLTPAELQLAAEQAEKKTTESSVGLEEKHAERATTAQVDADSSMEEIRKAVALRMQAARQVG